MKMSDLLKEDTGTDSDIGQGNVGSNTTNKGRLHPHHNSAIKNLTRFPDMPGHYYDMYRFGVHMAGAHNDPAEAGPAANELMTVAFSEVDEEIIQTTAKALGLTMKPMSGKKSEEPTDTNKLSPINKPKRNKYGI
jgi:hypothetical protein